MTLITRIVSSYKVIIASFLTGVLVGYYACYKLGQAALTKKIAQARVKDLQAIEQTHSLNMSLDKSLKELRKQFDVKQKELQNIDSFTNTNQEQPNQKTVIVNAKNPYLSKELVEVLNAD